MRIPPIDFMPEKREIRDNNMTNVKPINGNSAGWGTWNLDGEKINSAGTTTNVIAKSVESVTVGSGASYSTR